MTAVELDVLQGVDHVEPAAPGDDQSGQQDGGKTAISPVTAM